MDEITGVRLRWIEIHEQATGQEVTAQPLIGMARAMTDDDDDGVGETGFTMLRRTVMFTDFTDWTDYAEQLIFMNMRHP